MQRSSTGTSSLLARLCSRMSALPLGGFAAPPPTLLESARTAPRAGSRQPRRVEPTVDVRYPVRWTALSAVR